jgi:hypothetical protein
MSARQWWTLVLVCTAIVGAIAAFAFLRNQPAAGRPSGTPRSRPGAVPAATADTPSPRA